MTTIAAHQHQTITERNGDRDADTSRAPGTFFFSIRFALPTSVRKSGPVIQSGLFAFLGKTETKTGLDRL
jgi:hypothetical protein